MPVNACIYTRLSHAPDGSTEKVERQEADARQVAARLGWDIGRVYTDPSKSAWRRDVRRKDWEQMLEDLDAGRWDAVVVYHGDRLLRQPRDLERLLTIADERHLRLASVSGTRDLSNADDRFILRIEAAQACRESDNISRRTQRANRAAAHKGLPRQGRRRAFGWTADGTELVADEAAELRTAIERIVRGGSVVGIVRDLKDRAVATVDGGLWRVTTVRDMLTNPRIAGLAVYRGQVVGPSHRPAIVDEDTWRTLCGILAQRPGRKGPREGRYLLSGIARCGTCSGPLYVQRDKGRGLYLCRNDGCDYHVGRDQRQLDEYVTGVVLRLLADLEAEPAETTDPAGELRDALAGVEARARHLEAELRQQTGRSASLLLEAINDLDRRAEKLRASIAAVTHRPARHVRGITADAWEQLPLDRQRAIIGDSVTVTVLPAHPRGGRGGFKPEFVRVEPKW